MDCIIQTLLFTVLLILNTINSVQSAANKIELTCVPDGQNGDHCYRLYGSFSSGYTWHQAVAECSNMGQALLTIQDAQEQSHINNLLEIARSQFADVWIAGRVSEDQTLRYVDGHPVGAEVSLVTSTGECGVRNQQRFSATKCNASYETALCQYDADRCESWDFRYAGHCYHVYKGHMGSIEWDSARWYCRWQANGDLAYSSLGDSGLWQAAEAQINQSTDNTYIWLGFTSRHYVWVEGTVETPMNFTTNFKIGGSGKCVYLELLRSNWMTKFCADSCRYFICETDRGIAESSTQPTAQPTAQPTTQPGDNPDFTTKTPQNSTENLVEQNTKEPLLTKGQVVGLSVGLVLGVLILTVTVVVVTIFIRRRNQKPTSTAELFQGTVATQDFPLDENRTVTAQGFPLDENCTVTAQGPPLDEENSYEEIDSLNIAPLNTSPPNTAPLAIAPPNTAPLNTAPLNTAPLNIAPLNTAPPNIAPLNIAPLNTAPPNIAPLNIAPLNIAPPDTAPLNTAPPDTAPPNTAPLNTAPLNTAPLNTAPLNTAPPNTAPLNTAPPNTAPLNTAPLNTAPLNTAPPNTAPLNTAPLNTAPLNTAPPNTAPLNTAPLNTAPLNTAPPNTAELNYIKFLDFHTK